MPNKKVDKSGGKQLLAPKGWVKSENILPREKELVVNELKPLFGQEKVKGDLFITVRALTFEEATACIAARDSNIDSVVDLLETLLRRRKPEMVADEIENEFGVGQAMGKNKIAKYYHEVVARGIKEPKINKMVLYKISEHCPTVYQQIAQEILELTGQGPNVKKKSGD